MQPTILIVRCYVISTASKLAPTRIRWCAVLFVAIRVDLSFGKVLKKSVKSFAFILLTFTCFVFQLHIFSFYSVVYFSKSSWKANFLEGK